MDLKNALNDLAAKALRVKDTLETEEATKTALVMPFIRALGYDVFNPAEVTPEYTADVLGKKGEKVDYAILQEGTPLMFFECKPCGYTLEIKQASQLYRYFTATKVKLGILTNGITYQFFTDLEEKNKMDEKPFLIFNLLELEENAIIELAKITKSNFDLDNALAAASDLKYLREVKAAISREFDNPSEEMIRVLVRGIFQGRMTQTNIEYFRNIVKKSFRGHISELIKDKFSTVMAEGKEDQEPNIASTTGENNNGIITTEDELEAYRIIRAILTEVCEPSRVAMRDLKSYCTILLDDNNRKPLCRLFFGASEMSIGLFDKDKNLQKVQIQHTADIFKYAKELKETFANYEQA